MLTKTGEAKLFTILPRPDVRDLVFAHRTGGVVVERLLVLPRHGGFHPEKARKRPRPLRDRQVDRLLIHAVLRHRSPFFAAAPGVEH